MKGEKGELMKTKILCFCMTILGILLVCINYIPVYASVVDESIPAFNGHKEFNYARATLDLAPFDGNAYDQYEYFISKYVESGYIENIMTGKCSDDLITFKEKMSFTDSSLSKVEYYYNDSLFFESIIIDDHAEVIKDEEIFFVDIYNDMNAKFKLENVETDFTNLKLKSGSDEDTIYKDAHTYAFYYLGVMTVKENTYYQNKECHIVMPYTQMLSMEEIVDSVVIYDYSNNYTKRVDYTDYDPNNPTVGTYFMRVIAFDNYLHYTMQDVSIEVVDVIEPKIKLEKPIILDYPVNVTKEDLIGYFSVDEYSDYTYEVDFTNLKNEIGTYTLTLTVTDEYNNESSLDFQTKVVDKKAPYIGHTMSLNLSNLEYYDFDSIAKNSGLSIIDNYDGNIIDKATFVDLDDYQNNYHVPGKYRIQVNVSDSSGNEASSIIYLSVSDKDYPVIVIDKYLIVTEKGDNISKDDIIQLFNALGISLDDNKIKGEVFNLTSLDGEYEFNYEIDDEVLNGVVSTEVEDIYVQTKPITINEEIKKESNLTLILIISISSIALISFSILGVTLYKKRH